MEEAFSRRLADLARRAWEQGVPCFTHFLDLEAQDALHRALPALPPVPWRLFGGAEGCERVMLRLGDARDVPFPIVCLHVAPRSEKYGEALTHRDYLGALMALGIERELLGDIAVRGKEAWLFCEERIAPYLQEHFIQARRTFLVCAPSAPPEGPLYETRPVRVQVSSQRADALIARVFSMSRGDAQALFPAGKVFVNGRQCESPGHTPRAGDIISVRGFGRFRYRGMESLSKKGKENTAVELFV